MNGPLPGIAVTVDPARLSRGLKRTQSLAPRGLKLWVISFPFVGNWKMPNGEVAECKEGIRCFEVASSESEARKAAKKSLGIRASRRLPAGTTCCVLHEIPPVESLETRSA